MKGQSDKGEINQLVDLQGLRYNLRSNKGATSKEMEHTLVCRIGFTFCFSKRETVP